MNRGEREYFGETEVLDVSGGGEAAGHVGELDIDQLLRVQRAVVVAKE